MQSFNTFQQKLAERKLFQFDYVCQCLYITCCMLKMKKLGSDSSERLTSLRDEYSDRGC